VKRGCVGRLQSFITGAVGIAAQLAAAEPTSLIATPDDPEWLQRYYPYEQRVAGWIDNSARSIDSFFGTDDAWRTDNNSWLRIGSDLRQDKVDHLDNSLRVRLKLDVPTASKKLRLLVEKDDPEQLSAAQEAVPSLRSAADNNSSTLLGLGANLDSWAPQWTKKLQAGVRVGLPTDLYTRFIARRKWTVGGTWDLDSYNRLSWFGGDGYAANSQINIGEPLGPRWRLQYTTDLTWRENRDYLEFAESINFAHIIDDRTAINYSAGFTGTGFEGPQVNSYFVFADYRRNIFRHIIFFDAIPEFTFPRDEGFNPHWAMTLRLEFYFQQNLGN
jgi:hypothetical protein